MYTLSCVFALICAVLLPIALAVIFCVRRKDSWKPILFGALTFAVFQILTRMPLLLMVLPNYGWYNALEVAQPVLYALFLGATAALFEEGGRFFVMSLFLKKHRSTLSGVEFGIGHGGIEAILLVGINAIAMLLSPTELAAAGMVFAGGVERLSAMMLQIAFSVMVLKSVRDKNPVWLLAAFILHTAIDAATVLLLAQLGVWPLEALLLLVGGLLLWWTLKEVKKDGPATAGA